VRNKYCGFTLVEIAVVLVIIGLLLGGILKGRELIAGARVRKLAQSCTAFQTAYYGFIDRYRHVPGDWSAADASQAIGVAVTGGGNDDDWLTNVPGSPAVYTESNALWEQLSAARFIAGSYAGTSDTEPTTDNGLAPLNAFGRVMIIGRTDDYVGNNPMHLHLVIGRGVPVGTALELDTKLDDGRPNTGGFRATVSDADVVYFGLSHNWGAESAACLGPGGTVWKTNGDARDCNAAYLF
jgi:prepilin-type N-terminal cleavage/methylation domain-containing protein